MAPILMDLRITDTINHIGQASAKVTTTTAKEEVMDITTIKITARIAVPA